MHCNFKQGELIVLCLDHPPLKSQMSSQDSHLVIVALCHMTLLLIRLTLISFLKNHGYANHTYIIRIHIIPNLLVKLQIELLIKSYTSQIILVNTQLKTQHTPCITSSQSKSTQKFKKFKVLQYLHNISSYVEPSKHLMWNSTHTLHNIFTISHLILNLHILEPLKTFFQ